jgi:hypothetical protein
MRANIVFFFSYQEKPENEQDKAVSKLLMNFVDFCDRTDFEFQTIPRIGESIAIHDFVDKWFESEKLDNLPTRQMFYKAMKTADFKVFDVVHSLEGCTIHREEKVVEEIE